MFRYSLFAIRYSRAGFTIIELLVSMTIFLIITSIVVANFRQGSQRDDLQHGALLVASLLQQAQTYALAGRVTADLNQVSQVPPGGYGIYLATASKDKVLFFPDFNGNGLYDSNTETIGGWQYSLAKDVELESLAVSESNEPTVAFTFRPPQGTRYINDTVNGGVLVVILKHTKSLQQYKVTANAISGQVNTVKL